MALPTNAIVARDIHAFSFEVEQGGALRPASVMTIFTLLFMARDRKVGLDHLFYQLVKGCFVPPAEPLVRLGGIAEQEIDLSGSEIARVDFDHHLSRALVALPLRYRLTSATRGLL